VGSVLLEIGAPLVVELYFYMSIFISMLQYVANFEWLERI
jgi:hypothetical protein